MRSAGILFYTKGGGATEYLLARRNINPGKGYWGAPGGKEDPADKGDLWITAQRETAEEFGSSPLVEAAYARLAGKPPRSWLFWIPGLHFRTYAVELEAKPDPGEWPSRDMSKAPHNFEWSEFAWVKQRDFPRPVLPSLWRPVRFVGGALWL